MPFNRSLQFSATQPTQQDDIDKFLTRTSTPQTKKKSIFNRPALNNALFIGKEFLKEIPKELSRQVGQPALRGFAAIGAKIQARNPNALFVPQGEFQKNLYGTDKPISFTSLGKEVTGKDIPVVNPVLGAFFAGADAVPGGKGVKQGVKVGIKESKPIFQGFSDITTNVLNKLKGKSVVNKQFIQDLTNAPEMRQAERDIIREEVKDAPKKVNVKEFADRVKTRLVPLDSTNKFPGTPDPLLKEDPTGLYKGGKIMKHENITLDPEIRGNIADYYENIYQSPIKTSAGNIHYNAIDFPNYFAHTRVEDLADPNTRRVIEIQSDLFQKGRLEKELETPTERILAEQGEQGLRKELKNIGYTGKELEDEVNRIKQGFDPERQKELQQLQPYRNTWWERIIREEIKRAAQDGKTKLQFPTGKTAMQIEGLGGESTSWSIWHKGDYSTLKPEHLKQGREVIGNDGNEWVITDVLGDGKFKAVPKDIKEQALEEIKLRYEDIGEKPPKGIELKTQIDNLIEDRAETFDISGKVDTSNPIYKFYEKDVQKFLNKFGGKRVTDDRGVEWIEIPVKKEQAKEPVLAHGFIGQKPLAIGAGITTAGAGINALANGNAVTYERKPFVGPKKTLSTLKPKKLEGSFKGTNYDPYHRPQNRPNATSENLGEGAVAGLKIDESMVAVPRKKDNFNAMIPLGSVIYIPELKKKFLVADLMNKRFNGMQKIDFATPGGKRNIDSSLNKDFTVILLRKGKGRPDAREYVKSGEWEKEKNIPYE